MVPTVDECKWIQAAVFAQPHENENGSLWVPDPFLLAVNKTEEEIRTRGKG